MAWSFRVAMTFGALLFLVSACSSGGDDDDDDDDDEAQSAAQQQCTNLINLWCTTAIDCAVNGGLIPTADRNANLDACKSVAGSGLECSKAVDVTDAYDTCMNDITNLSCELINQGIQDRNLMLPATCEKVILLQN